MTTTAEKNRITAKFRKLFPDIADFRSYSFEKEIRDSYLSLHKVIYQGGDADFTNADLRKNETWVLFEGLLDLIAKHQSLNTIAALELESNIENCDEIVSNCIQLDDRWVESSPLLSYRKPIDGAYLIERSINAIDWECDYRLHSYGLACSLSNRPSNWESYYPAPEPELANLEGADTAAIAISYESGIPRNSYTESLSRYSEHEIDCILNGKLEGNRCGEEKTYALCCTLGGRWKDE